MMLILRYAHLDKRMLCAGIPILLAGLLAVTVFGANASSALSLQPVMIHHQADIIANGNVIIIGVASDISGPANSIGHRQANAVQLAVTKINEAGGVNIGNANYTINLISANSGCDAIQAAAAANTLINAGAVAVVGHSCSGATDVAQSLYAAEGVPMVSASATAPFVTEQGYNTTFRTVARDDSSPSALATYLFEEMDYQHAAIVELDGYWGNFANDVFSTTFGSLGGTITSRNAVSSTADFGATLSKIMSENPAVIHIVTDDGATAGLLSKIAYDLGMTDVPIAWTTLMADRSIPDNYTAAAGVAAEGDIAAMSQRPTDLMPGYAALNAEYVAAGFIDFGDEAQVWGALAYDATQIIIAAIDRANSADPAAVRDEISATANFQGVVGVYEGFDNKGDAIPQWTWMEIHQNGEWVGVWPHKVFLPLTHRD